MENIKSYVDRIWCSRHKSDVEKILIEYAQYKVNEFNKPDVMPPLPDRLVEGSNCDDNYKKGWIDCWNKVKGNGA